MQTKNNMRVIKKYQNRRLYDTSTSSYIILEDIKQIVVEGDMVQVVDVKTKADVTHNVLLQIILEEEVNRIPMFSNEFLCQIIRFYGKSFQASLSPFLEHGLDLFKKTQKQFYEQLRNTYGTDHIPSSAPSWHEFMLQQGPQLEGIIREYIQNSANTFLKVQEQLQQQTKNIFGYIPFPFNLTDKK